MLNKMLVAGVAILACAGGAVHAAGDPVRLTLEDMNFAPVLASKPDGPKVDHVWGDPREGAHGVMVKFPAGYTTDYRSNTAAQHGVVIKGTFISQPKGAAEGKKLGPGSYWFQPGDQQYSMRCEGSEECLLYMTFDGAYDIKKDEKAPATAQR